VTWALSGNKSAGTKISADGIITVGSDEPIGTKLTLTATSTYNPSLSATAVVYVETAAPPIVGDLHLAVDGTEALAIYVGADNASYHINAPLERFIRLWYKGTIVPTSNYSLTSGSTIITLTTSYCQSFPNGTYHMIAEYTDGFAPLTLIVDIRQPVVPPPQAPGDVYRVHPVRRPTPRTGDDISGIILLVGMVVGSSIVIVRMRKGRR